jgi:hypothetical protein
MLTFTPRLREPIMRGEVTCSVRIWKSPRAKVGGRYPLGSGHVEVTGLTKIDLSDVDDALARRSGFEDREALLAIARHGRGERVFLVEFACQPDVDGLGG